MQLHFYGCRVKDPQTGELERHEDWQRCYKNLNYHYHNNLRITRVLKCLGEMGYEHYKKPFLDHFIKEIWVEKLLPNCADSCADYWIGTIKDDATRVSIEEKVASYRASAPADGDSDSEDAVEQSWTSSRPTVHTYPEHEADNAGSDDEDDTRTTTTKLQAPQNEEVKKIRRDKPLRRISKEKSRERIQKSREKSSKEKDDDESLGASGSNTAGSNSSFFISKPKEFSSKDEKKYLGWIGAGPTSEEDTEEDDFDENIYCGDAFEDISDVKSLDPEAREKYHRWVAEHLGANSDDDYTNQYLDDDDEY